MEQIRTRFRIPGVLNMSDHERREASISIFNVERICAISARANSDPRLPSAWYLTRISKASSERSLLISHLGDSGRNLVRVSGYSSSWFEFVQDKGNLKQ